MVIFKVLFGKPLIDHKVYIFIYCFLLLVYVGLGALLGAASFPWHFLLAWAILFPIIIRADHAIVKKIYHSWVNRGVNVKMIGGALGAIVVNLIAFVALILYASYYSPNGSFVFNYKQSQINEHTYEVSASMLRGKRDTDLYIGIPVQEPSILVNVPYEALIGEGAFTVELYNKKSDDVVWSKEITDNVRGTMEFPAVEGKYWIRLIAEESAKDIMFRFSLE
ncbi:hypothetical protein P4637_16375 [Halalkalibacterium halodurans]|uniref:BH2519 protein n=1 Tax=Halalkalibacterium halodurans (strain ATCC BAA-125 / DSM 18197 / FERM 7344 / JCM 9153 / C-125) TaxID=272558 RepID=Q9K9X5_HALH5|nr:hypothetical protein [Halalkalibacterium halodurans]MED4079669.1 hypothetical protein [Halalkalibacterium halodurans]MED4086389.1 hypothetical protein [Halalkalibacterium halodurans]MED4103266.1 hypothetical protein [Halalkalibacterium halodurans]MED4108037.1 hypothetical protein [Halalkalibacterium halodurans]MED4124510.1 hypothetical protein [Halalkalibacterium halodurans]